MSEQLENDNENPWEMLDRLVLNEDFLTGLLDGCNRNEILEEEGFEEIDEKEQRQNLLRHSTIIREEKY